MTGFCSLDEAQVLTKDGFYRIWQQKVRAGMPQTAAYDETETLHRRISATHSSMYNGIGTFKRIHYREKSRQRQQGARQGVA